MSLDIRLLGRPAISSPSREVYRFRSRKSWALLAYLILGERSPTRSQVAALLFDRADDPLRAARWSLTEIRRALGNDGSIEGDPVTLTLEDDVTIDTRIVTRGAWTEAVELDGLGSTLLDGIAMRGSPSFETWLLSEQHHLAAASEAILHEAALGMLSRGDLASARDFAVRAAAMNPLDENHQALVIRLYRLAGDAEGAERQYAAFCSLLRSEMGLAPGPAVLSARRERPMAAPDVVDRAAIEAIVEAGTAAIAAGSIESGVESLRTAVRLADGVEGADLRVRARLQLGAALVHSYGGHDEEGLAYLHEAAEHSRSSGMRDALADAQAELGYVDFLRARYDRSSFWLTAALDTADGEDPVRAKATGYLGSVESDRAAYRTSAELLDRAVRLSAAAGARRHEAYGRAMAGRLRLLTGDLDGAADELERCIALAESDHWHRFLPWPQALLGEVQVVGGDLEAASRSLEQAFARACQIGDPCWEGISGRGLGLLLEARGDAEGALDRLADARSRCRRLPDPYVWLDVHILDAQCRIGIDVDHPGAAEWVAAMKETSARTGMREMVARSLLHGARLGIDGDRELGVQVAAGIENPRLTKELDGRHGR